MIELKNLKILNDEKIIIDNQSFVFQDGQTYLISGNNGSGKSTLLKVLANDIDEDKYQHLKVLGSILCDGEDVLQSDSARERFNKNLCYVSQDDIFITSNIGKELITYYKISNNKRITIEEIVKVIENLGIIDILLKTMNKKSIEEVMKLKIDSLSGGQKKILHIVEELIKNINAKYVIFDEPLNNLDMNNIANLSNLIRKCLTKEQILIIVSHWKVFPFINIEIAIDNAKFKQCQYTYIDCFGKVNDEGLYE